MTDPTWCAHSVGDSLFGGSTDTIQNRCNAPTLPVCASAWKGLPLWVRGVGEEEWTVVDSKHGKGTGC